FSSARAAHGTGDACANSCGKRAYHAQPAMGIAARAAAWLDEFPRRLRVLDHSQCCNNRSLRAPVMADVLVGSLAAACVYLFVVWTLAPAAEPGADDCLRPVGSDGVLVCSSEKTRLAGGVGPPAGC